jgi:hypothetical protein
VRHVDKIGLFMTLELGDMEILLLDDRWANYFFVLGVNGILENSYAAT